MFNVIIIFVSSLVFLASFFWAIDAIIHKRKSKIPACVVSAIAFAVWSLYFAVFASS